MGDAGEAEAEMQQALRLRQVVGVGGRAGHMLVAAVVRLGAVHAAPDRRLPRHSQTRRSSGLVLPALLVSPSWGMIPSSAAKTPPSSAQRHAVLPPRAPSSPRQSDAAGAAPPPGGRPVRRPEEATVGPDG